MTSYLNFDNILSMDINTPKELAQNISRFVNTFARDKNDEFIEQMAIEHRTLQQAFTRLCLQWLEYMASLPDNRIDLRNEASRNVARALLTNAEIQEEYGEKPSRYLPTV